MTKAEHIRKLYAHGIFTTREIADHVGCKIEYVRVCARQRDETGVSDIDRKYMTQKSGSLRAYYTVNNAARREYRKEYYARRYREDPEYRRLRKQWAAASRKRRARQLEAAQ